MFFVSVLTVFTAVSEKSIQVMTFSVFLWKMHLLLVLIAVLEPSYLVTVCFSAKSIVQPLTKHGTQHY